MPVVRELTTRLGYKIEDRDLKRYDNQLGSLTSSLGGLATAAIAAGVALASLGAKAFLSNLIETNVSFEKMKASLETVTGSAEKANSAFAFIQKFAATTPFALSEVSNAFIKLKAMGIEPTEERLKSFGNTASAWSLDLNQFVEAVADAVTGEFDRLKSFGIKAKSEGDKVAFTFQNVTTTVGKNSKEITAYLESIGNTQFAGAMAKQMLTLGGIASNLKDNIDKFMIGVGESGFNDALRRFMSLIRDLVAGSDDLAVAIGKGLGNALDALTNGIKWLSDNKAVLLKIGLGLNAIFNPLARLYVVVTDLIALMSGEDSLIEEWLGPEAADFIRRFGEALWTNIVKSFEAMVKVGKQLVPVVKKAFIDLQPAFKTLLKTGRTLIKTVIAPFHDMTEDNLLPELIEASLPLIILLVKGLTIFLELTAKSLAGWLKFANVVIPELRIAWIVFMALLSGWFEQVKINWLLLNGFIRGQWEATITLLRGFWALINGDVLGAIDNWTGALNRFIENLRTVGVDLSSVGAVVNQARSFAGLGTGQAGAIPPGAASGSGAPGTAQSIASSVTSSIGNLIVQIQGGTSMGPDQVASAVKTGAGSALKDSLADASRNTVGAVA